MPPLLHASPNDSTSERVEPMCADNILGPVTADSRCAGVRDVWDVFDGVKQLYRRHYSLRKVVPGDGHLGDVLVA
jgi:hypothetical protein